MKTITLKDKIILNEILELIIADFPCKNAEDKFGRQIEQNLSEEGIEINFNEWISEVDTGIQR